MRKIIAVAFATLAILACSGGGGIGAQCSTASDCSGANFCNQRDVCTRDCTTHADCGCAPNTTNADIAAGRCNVSCANVGTVAVCLKTCATNANCNGLQTCTPATDSTGASLGFSQCT